MNTVHVAGNSSHAKSWLRALELTAPIPRSPQRIFPTVIEELAEKFGDAPALISDRETLTYRGVAEQSYRYTRWALDHGLGKGDVVCLMMPNRPEYMAIWLGITRVGAIVALLNTNLAGPSLAHCVRIAAPKCIIVSRRATRSGDPCVGRQWGTIWSCGSTTRVISRNIQVNR